MGTRPAGFTLHRATAKAFKSGMNASAWDRDYDPELGRRISEDPAGFIDGPNRYAYGRNNPVRYLDRDGRSAAAVALPVIIVCSPDPVTKGAMVIAAVAAGAMILYEVCKDGACFSRPQPKRERYRWRDTCDKLLYLCLTTRPARWSSYGRDCGACHRECVRDKGAWPFYKCPIDQ
jgi:RHS repeat-associated protein